MLTIPAIDIKNGKCVRLTQGKFDNVTIYSNDPVQIAKQFEKDGAKMIHVIDLDGAKTGKPANLDTIKNIVKSVSIPIQVGGGIRTLETIKTVLNMGVSRVILGTIALEQREELKKILKKFGSQIIIALDTKNGKLMKKGWQEESASNFIDIALNLENFGVKRFIYTDVINDGMLSQPNYKEITKLLKKITVPIITGGGVTNIETVKKLKKLGIEGVIIGKALYEGKINLKEALNAG